ncbi:MAG: glycoside hydrolase family 3 C-terminal domain-containing protein [Propionibacteriaceae bacterium]|jgi:beta-glucosidase|nr:glycoside hydrolase family 3 C-terminal domain-containing protein [Propionibacteriaceae bacterium]
MRRRTPSSSNNPARKLIATAAAAALGLSLVGVAPAWAGTTAEVGPLEAENNALSRLAATEGMVLLENNDQVLPIAKGNLAVFGVGAYATVKGGTGSGEVNQRATINDYNVLTGLTQAGYTISTNADYLAANKAAIDQAAEPCAAGGGFFGAKQYNYAACEQALTPAWTAPTKPTDDAIFVVTRNAGEGADRSAGKGDYLLGDTERANIAAIAAAYKHLTVVLNVGGQVDTSFFDEINAQVKGVDGSQAIDALLLMSQAGQQSGQALGDVLSGAANPSGHLVDTWTSQYSYYPAAATFANADGNTVREDYSEGIYVGYRYFDSFYKTINPTDPAAVVAYPYGYGLSYSTFDIKPVKVEVDGAKITARVAVTNSGDVAGKQVVQVYVSSPAGDLDKPYQELAAYAKTDSLDPGQCQVLDLTFNAADLASYDQIKSAWVLEAGDYLLRIGDSSRSTEVAAKVSLATTVTTEQLSSQMVADEQPASELQSDPANFYGYAAEAGEITAAPVAILDPEAIVTVNNTSAYSQRIEASTASGVGQIDNGLVSAITAYIDAAQADDWQGTGQGYSAKVGETITEVTTDPDATLADVKSGAVSMEQYVAGLSVAQLARIASGLSLATVDKTTLAAVGAAGYTAAIEEQDIAAMVLSDGPAGLRLSQSYTNEAGQTEYQWATAFPIGTMLAQTWNDDLVKQVGTGIGKEMNFYGATIWLAPGMNIHRDPLNGRNFEYYSEDPLQSGLVASAVTLGVQSQPGVGVSLKHYAMNNQETARNSADSVVSERAQREIYLKGFEIVVKSAQPMTVMSSYNKINGTWASMNYDLLTDVLRGEWGFDGFVMTDWGGNHSVVASMYSGNDLIEPGDNSGDIVNALMDLAPTIDINGLPVVTPVQQWWSLVNNFAFNGITPSASGAQTFTTVIDAERIKGTPASQMAVNGAIVPVEPYASVDAAYANAQAMYALLSNAQKAGVAITPTVTNPDTGAVEAYTVTIRGDYPAHEMRLGDLQRSVMHILNVDMQSLPYAELTGTTAQPYSAQFDNLVSYLTVSASQPLTVDPDPAISLTADSAQPASGWYNSDVTVTASADDPAYTIDLSAAWDDGHGGGTLESHLANPVLISQEGATTITAAVSCDCGQDGSAELVVQLDKTAPLVDATVVDQQVTIDADDALSGLASIEYSLDGGKTWQLLGDSLVTFPVPATISYRATDLAGNVSDIGTVKLTAPGDSAGGGTVKPGDDVNQGSGPGAGSSRPGSTAATGGLSAGATNPAVIWLLIGLGLATLGASTMAIRRVRRFGR